MNAKEKNNISSKIKELEEALKFKNEKDRIEINASFIQLDILDEIKQLMKERNLSRKELASKMNKSNSFVSQLFSGDKALNLKMIAQFQEIFNTKFVSSFENYSEYTKQGKYNKTYYLNKNYKKITPIFNLKDYEENKAA